MGPICGEDLSIFQSQHSWPDEPISVEEKLECRAVFYAEEKLPSQKTTIHVYTLHNSRKSIKAVKIIILWPH